MLAKNAQRTSAEMRRSHFARPRLCPAGLCRLLYTMLFAAFPALSMDGAHAYYTGGDHIFS